MWLWNKIKNIEVQCFLSYQRNISCVNQWSVWGEVFVQWPNTGNLPGRCKTVCTYYAIVNLLLNFEKHALFKTTALYIPYFISTTQLLRNYVHSLYYFSFRRNLDYFQHCHFSAMSAVDPDNGNGEITVRLPPEMYLNIAGNYNDWDI